MSLNNHETPMLHHFWQQVGGTLVEEFYAVQRSPGHSERRMSDISLAAVVTLGSALSMGAAAATERPRLEVAVTNATLGFTPDPWRSLPLPQMAEGYPVAMNFADLGVPDGAGWYFADKTEPICASIERLATLPFVSAFFSRVMSKVKEKKPCTLPSAALR